MNIEKFRKILNAALHPSTDEGTRSIAIRKIEAMMTTNDFTIDDINVGDECHDVDAIWMEEQVAKAEVMRAKAMAESKSLKAQLKSEKAAWRVKTASYEHAVETLKAENERLAESEATLKKENARLRKKTQAVAKGAKSVTSDTGVCYSSFEQFKKAARTVYGRDFWHSAFAHEAGITVKELRAWETVDLIPDHLASKLDVLDEEQRKPASRKRWSVDEVERLKVLLANGADYLESAHVLSREFERRIFESSILRRRQALFREEGWSPPPKSGALGNAGIFQ